MSGVGLEELFPAAEDGSPELRRLRDTVRECVRPHEATVLWLQRLLVWERPLHSACAAALLNTGFWLLTSTSLRPVFLLSVSLLGLVLSERWKHKLPSFPVHSSDATFSEREAMAMHPQLLSIPELCHHLAESFLTCTLYIQEMLQYKRLNPGKFCLVVCSGCLALAVVGHYIPGIMISYIILLSVLLWPLVVYHELIQRMYTGLEPVLMKLDYSMKGGTRHRKHDKKKVKKDSEEGDEPQAETESESEEELSCFATTVDVKTTALAMAITDSELSDEEASILESGGFSVSRATTPQLTDVSEDLDQQSINSELEEPFPRDASDFPMGDEFPSIACLGSASPGASTDLQQLSPTSQLLQHLHFVNSHFNGQTADGSPSAADVGELSLEALSEEIVSTAISTVVQNTLSAMLHASETSEGFSSTQDDDETTTTTDTPTERLTEPLEQAQEEEDFELLDQSELENVYEEHRAAVPPDPIPQSQES